jgi:hypothetical protein
MGVMVCGLCGSPPGEEAEVKSCLSGLSRRNLPLERQRPNPSINWTVKKLRFFPACYVQR